MSMGLKNTPAMFMRTINSLFSDMLDFGMPIFLNDVFVYLHMAKEHFTLLEKTLAHLCQYTFYCKLKKCSFLYNSTMLFGFDIAPEGLCISDLKV